MRNAKRSEKFILQAKDKQMSRYRRSQSVQSKTPQDNFQSKTPQGNYINTKIQFNHITPKYQIVVNTPAKGKFES